MKIRLKQIMAGPEGMKDAGTIAEFSEEVAAMLIETGQAEAIEESKQSDAKVEFTEHGMDREKAVSPKRRKLKDQ